MKKWLLGIGLVFAAMVLMVLISWGWTLTVQPDLEVGPDTTVVEGPLRENGTVDYVAALNNEYSEGVTLENNAYAVLVELIYPKPGETFAEVRPQIFEALGKPQPDEDARYLVPIGTYAELQAADDPRWEEEIEPTDRFAEPRWRIEWERARDGPWAAEDAPLVAEWLEEHAWALDRAKEGVAREQFWAPLVVTDPDDLLWGALFPHLPWARQFAVGWEVRALHRLEAGDLEGAMADVVAMQQFAAHFKDQPQLIGRLAGTALSSLAASTVGEIAADENLSAEQARQLKRQLAELHGRFALTAAIDLGERFFLLDFIQRLGVRGGVTQSGLAEETPALTDEAIDRNRAMRQINARYDQAVAAAEAPTHSERVAQWERLSADVERAAERWSQPSLGWVGLAVGSRKSITDATTAQLVSMTISSFDRVDLVVDRTVIDQRLSSLALAVAGYRAEHGDYPETLDDLVPEWFDELPIDLFDEQARPLRYRLEEERVVLYSVGDNGRDDGGEEGENLDEGDQVIQWPR